LNGIQRLILWTSQGFGLGRFPVAPGTIGTLGGFPLLALLLLPGNFMFFAVGCLALGGISVWTSGEAEKLLNRSDPGSVVIDEIAAIPVCYLSWIIWLIAHNQAFPSPLFFFQPDNFMGTIGIFFTFRLFDVWKPWLIGQSQKLRAGWGITVDDFLAALVVNLLVLGVLCLKAIGKP